ncbi:hypothetical protein ACDA63_15130 [Uliginosibacterium sp. sgz301328]|uniref:hypothetical protein n=1 Tax=Uliginosibacterium sp. sgz301328 TaxID=3243764 RepID=UPI00359DBE74
MRLAALTRQIEDTIWQFSSPTIGQAEFAEWITTQMRAAGVNDARVSQPTFRSLSGDVPQGAAATAPSSTSGTCADGACGLVELRAGVRFAFNAGGLTKALAAIEGASRLSAVEQLNASAREGRVDMTVVTVARVIPIAGTDRAGAIVADAGAPSNGAPAPAPAAPAPKKIVQVRW